MADGQWYFKLDVAQGWYVGHVHYEALFIPYILLSASKSCIAHILDHCYLPSSLKSSD